MKILKTMALLLLSTFTFFACQKEESLKPTDTVEGLWVGDNGFGNDSPDIYFSFNIKPGGVIEELNSNQGVKGSGTWQLVGDEFSATYTWDAPYFSTYSVTATFDKDHSKLKGYWGYDDSALDGGKWEMEKVE